METRSRDARPWGLVGAAIVILLIAIVAVGVVGVIQNERVKDTAERAIAFDVEVEDNGDDLRVAVLDLRHYHRNIVFGGVTDQSLAEFDAAYGSLLEEIDELDEIGIGELDIPQPAYLRELAALYYDEFRPQIVLYLTDPVAFNSASDAGLERIAELDRASEEIDDLGEELTERSLARVRSATARERVALLSMLSAVALVGIALAIAAGRVVERLRAANLQQHASARRLADTLQSQSDFIADASHELRTPLTLIRGNAEIELAAEPDPDSRQALSEILAESTRMSRLVEDLLFLARSDAGAPPIEREYVPVRWLLSRLSTPVEAMARNRDVCTALDLTGEGHVEVDAGRIEQAVLILVDNASKFSPDDACVEIKSSTDGGFLTIAVADAGPGIPAEELPMIFERFYQVGTRRTRRKGGSGLGLAIAKSIVEAHGGTIGIESSPGGGTTATIRLPLSRQES